MDLPINEIVCGDCLTVLRDLPDRSVHCVVTSPPYWGFRDYGVPGQLGLESTPDEYVAKIVEVFREVRRVLRDDGMLWLVLGDGYANDGKWGGETGGKQAYLPDNDRRRVGREKRITGLKPKDLIGMPWRVAFALQADGWYLRQDIIWHKPNGMPENVTDRCTNAHDYIFLLSKKAKYFYDAKAVEEPCESGPSDIRKMQESLERIAGKHKVLDDRLSKASMHTNIGRKRAVGDPSGRNKRSVWTVPTCRYKGEHFATYPPELIRPCIRAGTSEKGCCPQCGAPWERVVKKARRPTRPGEQSKVYRAPAGWDISTGKGGHGRFRRDGREKGRITYSMEVGNRDPGRHVTQSQTVGWRPMCHCDRSVEKTVRAKELVPCIVLDPFAGSGTTGVVAAQEKRNYILVELNPEYIAMARERLSQVETGVPLAERRAGQMGLLDEE